MSIRSFKCRWALIAVILVLGCREGQSLVVVPVGLVHAELAQLGLNSPLREVRERPGFSLDDSSGRGFEEIDESKISYGFTDSGKTFVHPVATSRLASITVVEQQDDSGDALLEEWRAALGSVSDSMTYTVPVPAGGGVEVRMAHMWEEDGLRWVVDRQLREGAQVRGRVIRGVVLSSIRPDEDLLQFPFIR